MTFDEATYKLTGLNLPDSAPQIEASGRIAGYPIDADRVLLVLSLADRETKDPTGEPLECP